MSSFFSYSSRLFYCFSVDVSQVAGVLSALLEILDIASLSDGFEITGGFKSSWRAHVWEGKKTLLKLAHPVLKNFIQPRDM